jgi:hypothetical protein
MVLNSLFIQKKKVSDQQKKPLLGTEVSVGALLQIHLGPVVVALVYLSVNNKMRLENQDASSPRVNNNTQCHILLGIELQPSPLHGYSRRILRGSQIEEAWF